MRHQKAGRKLNRTGSHRDAMFRNMVTSLLTYGRIKTTDAKAKELRRWADRMITLAKRGDLHARRQVLSVVRDKAVVHKLFEEALERFGARAGGYTRIIKIGRRTGDGAPMSLIEFAKPEEKKKPKKKKPKAGKKAAPKAPKETATVAPKEKVKKTDEAESAAEEKPKKAKAKEKPEEAKADKKPKKTKEKAETEEKPKKAKAKAEKKPAKAKTAKETTKKAAPEEKKEKKKKTAAKPKDDEGTKKVSAKAKDKEDNAKAQEDKKKK
jgi:large subunit ribosomal protein L17